MTRFSNILLKNKLYSRNENFLRKISTSCINDQLDNLQCYVPQNLQYYAPGSPVSNTIIRHTHTPSKSITNFYDGKSVLVTGGTGFLGKVLVEKLLYETEVENLFMLIREKNGECVNRRVDEMLSNPIFDRLKETKPAALDKIIPIVGDIVVPDLGMRTQDVKTLSDKVSIVFNMAASVIFEEPVRTSMNFNYEGTKRVLNLAHQMQTMESFVHVSSTYAYAFDGEATIKEALYPRPENHERLQELAEKYNDDEVEIKKFIGKRANIYTYCKALAESYVVENHGNIPTCIVRPSSISAKKDPPHPGWMDNWFGPTRTYYTAAKGWNHLCFGKAEYCLDLIPVDYVANLCIIAAAKNDGSKSVPVFNSSSTGVNPLSLKLTAEYLLEDAVKFKMNDIPYPFMIFTSSKWMYSVYTLLLQSIPIRIVDGWLWITGRKPKYTKREKSVTKLRETLSFFTNNSWVIECDNARSLYRSLSERDQKRFPCDPVNIDWRKYLHDYLLGIEKYMVKTKSKQN